ncbi:MAG: hypothetical protein ICV62_18025 [Cyanobacteria bacterium Co-bin13]|nr:hypothetical protein [Cyanobacteria bacterium Co-bin13]
MTALNSPTHLALEDAFNMTTEVFLVTFIRWALQVTASGDCTGETALILLNQAWIAQRLLWRLREANLRFDGVGEATPAPAALPLLLPARDRSPLACS